MTKRRRAKPCTTAKVKANDKGKVEKAAIPEKTNDNCSQESAESPSRRKKQKLDSSQSPDAKKPKKYVPPFTAPQRTVKLRKDGAINPAENWVYTQKTSKTRGRKKRNNSQETSQEETAKILSDSKKEEAEKVEDDDFKKEQKEDATINAVTNSLSASQKQCNRVHKQSECKKALGCNEKPKDENIAESKENGGALLVHQVLKLADLAQKSCDVFEESKIMKREKDKSNVIVGSSSEIQESVKVNVKNIWDALPVVTKECMPLNNSGNIREQEEINMTSSERVNEKLKQNTAIANTHQDISDLQTLAETCSQEAYINVVDSDSDKMEISSDNLESKIAMETVIHKNKEDKLQSKIGGKIENTEDEEDKLRSKDMKELGITKDDQDRISSQEVIEEKISEMLSIVAEINPDDMKPSIADSSPKPIEIVNMSLNTLTSTAVAHLPLLVKRNKSQSCNLKDDMMEDSCGSFENSKKSQPKRVEEMVVDEDSDIIIVESKQNPEENTTEVKRSCDKAAAITGNSSPAIIKKVKDDEDNTQKNAAEDIVKLWDDSKNLSSEVLQTSKMVKQDEKSVMAENITVTAKITKDQEVPNKMNISPPSCRKENSSVVLKSNCDENNNNKVAKLEKPNGLRATENFHGEKVASCGAKKADVTTSRASVDESCFAKEFEALENLLPDSELGLFDDIIDQPKSTSLEYDLPDGDSTVEFLINQLQSLHCMVANYERAVEAIKKRQHKLMGML